MSEPVLLDLFCGAGGAAAGYEAAGFTRIVGVDNKPQPHYPYEFVLADALEYLAEYGHLYAAFHASPPCQGYSIMHNLPWLRDREYPLLIKPVVEMLNGLGKPYVVENVMGARKGSKTLEKRGLADHGLEAAWLCGMMFGRPFYRHRLFATNWMWLAPTHPVHIARIRPGRQLGGRARQFDPYYVRNQKEGLNLRPGYESKAFNYPTLAGNLVGHSPTPGQRATSCRVKPAPVSA